MAGGVRGGGHMWEEHAWWGGAYLAGDCAWWWAWRGKRACMTEGGMYGRGRGASVAGGDMHSKGACMVRGACVTGEMATAVDSTHPTGMHSCFSIVLVPVYLEIHVFHQTRNPVI